MSKSHDKAEITPEDAISILETQSAIYQHIQEQALQIARTSFAFIALLIASASVIVSIGPGIDWSQFILVSPERLSEYAQNAPEPAWLMYLQLYPAHLMGLASLMYAGKSFLEGIYNAIGLLSAPDLEPYATHNIAFKVTAESSTNTSSYQNWINTNKELLKDKRTQLNEIYWDIHYALLLAAIFIPLLVVTHFAYPLLILFYSMGIAFLIAIGLYRREWILTYIEPKLSFEGGALILWSVILISYLVIFRI